ncbi:MAG TPA: response regulator transcription factor [Chitinophagaceae bacterium]|jgi:DNA-binding NarL/FixJ family response regulator|nr:response regulator transcription factor [Chitinophagaceae bacterium]
MRKQITISIVEDLEAIRNGVVNAIGESEDLLCISAYEKAEDALEELGVLKPDITLMDINLPGMDGIACIKKLKAKCPEMQFMMFTIYDNSEQVFEALAAGANGYLLKKTPHEQILEALRELHQGGAPMSTHIARKVVSAFQKKTGIPESDNPLSPREQEVLKLLSKGYLYKEIGDRLQISTGTVRQHIHKIYEKLHVQNRTEALNKYYGSGTL